jgi:hypothetical protein
MNVRLVHIVWALALFSVIFSFSMCSYTSFSHMNMGVAHAMNMNDSLDHSDHAISLFTAIIPIELTLLFCSFAFIFLLKFLQDSSDSRFAYKRVHYESRPPNPVISRLSFSLRSPPSKY